jgi:hypothetical protein
MMPTTKKKITWRGSKARGLLEKDLIGGDIPLDANVRMQGRCISSDRNLPTLSTITFGTAYDICELRSKKRRILLLLLALRLLMTVRSIPKQLTIIEANCNGKGRKRNCFFDWTWMMAKTRA